MSSCFSNRTFFPCSFHVVRSSFRSADRSSVLIKIINFQFFFILIFYIKPGEIIWCSVFLSFDFDCVERSFISYRLFFANSFSVCCDECSAAPVRSKQRDRKMTRESKLE